MKAIIFAAFLCLTTAELGHEITLIPVNVVANCRNFFIASPPRCTRCSETEANGEIREIYNIVNYCHTCHARVTLDKNTPFFLPPLYGLQKRELW